MSDEQQAPQNEEIFEKLNDYTLSVVHDFVRNDRADPELRRIFNFAAQNITTIYSMWYGEAVASNMQVQNFSELDSLDEVARMHAQLCQMDGHPPPLPARDTPGKPAALRPPRKG